MSDHLKAFLAAWLEWVEKGAPEDEPFTCSYGLCSNFSDWMVAEKLSWSEMEPEEKVLKALFVSEGLDKDYPFGGVDTYWDEQDEGTLHLNEARIAWVRSKVAQHVAA